MTWEETIEAIRKKPEFKKVVRDAYLGSDLEANIEKFRNSVEFKLTLQEIEKQKGADRNLKILDIGAGNGISSISFALAGFQVTALEPDPSETVGAGAIKNLAEKYKLANVNVHEGFGEKLPFENETFDIVYGRQVMHHAHELNQFVADAARVLKKGGVFMTVRDHVISNETEKEKFLNRHPLHRFYGGENAFTFEQYQGAILKAGLSIKEELGPADSAINYSPWSEQRLKEVVESKIGFLGKLPMVNSLAWIALMRRLKKLPGRLHSFIAIK